MRCFSLRVLLFSTFLLFNGCVQTPQPDTPKRVSFLFKVENIGENIIANEDTIQVGEIKLLADKFNLTQPGDAILQTDIDALAMIYLSSFNGEDETVLSANIGFEDIDRFEGIELFISPPKNDDNIQDDDFFGDQMNYSFILRGIINGENFTFKSGPEFERTFDFDDTIELTNEEETLVLRIQLNMREIIIDESNNQILDPRNQNNQAKLDSLMQEAINIQAFSANLF